MKRSRSINDDLSSKRVKPVETAEFQEQAKAPEKVDVLKSVEKKETEEAAEAEKIKEQAKPAEVKEEAETTEVKEEAEVKETLNKTKDDAEESDLEAKEPPTAGDKTEETLEKSSEKSPKKNNEPIEKAIDKDQAQKPQSAPKPFSGFSSFTAYTKGGFGSFGSTSSTEKTKPDANPWAEKEEPKKDEPKPEDKDAFAQVTLSKQELKTGEEDEITVHSLRARLYAVDNEAKAWKERGTGVLKLNRFTGQTKFRLVMRSDSVLKVSLNLPLFKDMQLNKGFSNSLHTERFVRFSGIENGEGKQFAVRCSSESARDELFTALDDAIKSLNK